MKSARTLGSFALVGVIASFAGRAVTPTPASAMVAFAGEKDVVTFRNGSQVEGVILEETATTLRMRVEMYGISSETVYDKKDVLSIVRADKAPGGEAPADPTPSPAPRSISTPNAQAPADANAKRVYVVNLAGQFGRDISQTPIRNAVEDARKNNAQVIIFALDAEWKFNEFEEAGDDAAAFDQLFRCDEIFPILREEIPRRFDEDPQIVFWIKKAMGGAAFLPLVCPNIYFHPDARMGGIGNLSTMFGSTGDEVVRQKQLSLRLATAEGAAIEGGYDVAIVRAMSMIEKVYSYRMEGGKPVFIEGYPDPSRGEILLTDDGIDANRDSDAERVRHMGNDVLTLDAVLAQKLRLSDGTCNTIDDVIYALGLSRSHVRVDKDSDKIMESWSQGVVNAERKLMKLAREFQEIQVQGDYRERSRARGQQINKLEEMQSIIRRYKEALRLNQIGVPDENQIQIFIEQIKLEQLADQK